VSDAGQWARVSAVFEQALERDEATRAAFLDRACDGDGALRAEVESLLAAHHAAGSFAEGSPLQALPGSAIETLGRDTRVAPGSRLGAYEIAAPLGAGGMGEVYRARDPKLNREVALKVLPGILALDRDRLARFTREAQILAALNHPNIVTVHSVEEDRGIHFITMELVKGKTLADLLPQGGFPLDRFFDIAIALADAVAAAHAEAIVHRDLKPANVMVAAEGRVKVLDFGLARPAAAAATGPEHVTAAMTEQGVVIGTRSYMSPEQARGEGVDARSDIFALGVILYEMLTGRQPFTGATPADVLSSVIRDVPPAVSSIRAGLPRELSGIVRRCLAKDPARRLQSALDLRNELDDLRRELDSGELLADVPPAVATRARGRAIWPAVITVAILVTGLIGWIMTRPSENRVPRLQRAIQVTFAAGVETQPTWSPDGGRIAYVSDRDGNQDIWVAQAAGGSAANFTADHRGFDRDPSWSPDGSQIAFVSERDGGGVFVMPAIGGSPTRISPYRLGLSSPQWSADGSEIAIVFREGAGSLIDIVSTRTRESRRLRIPGDAGNRFDLSWSPDGRFFAYVRAPARTEGISRIWMLRASDQQEFPVTDGKWNDWSPSWSPDSRSIFFVSNRDGTMDLWQQRLAESGVSQGDPVAVTIGVGMQHAAFSRDGRRLVYSQGRPVANVWRVPMLDDREAGWDDAERITSDQAHIAGVDVDAAGERLVMSSDRGGNPDLWTLTVRGNDITRLTTDATPDHSPRFSKDGGRIAFQSYRGGSRDIWVVPSEGGPAAQLTRDPGVEMFPSWSIDGRQIAFYSDREGGVSDGFVMPLEGGAPRQVLKGPSRFLQWSPDGAWIGYTTSSRRFARVPAAGGPPQELTNEVGSTFRWSGDGERIYFGRDGELWALTLAGGAERRLTRLSGRAGSMGNYALAAGPAHLYFTWSSDLGDIWVMDVAAPIR
jgi:Tol biopolymer transport system component